METACAVARTPEEEEEEEPAEQKLEPRHPRLEVKDQLNTIATQLERKTEELHHFEAWTHAAWPQLRWVEPESKRLQGEIKRLRRQREDARESLECLDDWLNTKRTREPRKPHTTTRSSGSWSGTRAREQWQQDAWSYSCKQGWHDEQQHERKQVAWSCYSSKQGWHEEQQHKRKPKGKSRGKGRAAAGKRAPAATRRGHLGHRDRGVERDLDQSVAGGGVALEVQRLQGLDQQVGRPSAQVPAQAEADPHPSAASRGLLSPRTCPSRGA